jgi:hypothetical protein
VRRLAIKAALFSLLAFIIAACSEDRPQEPEEPSPRDFLVTRIDSAICTYTDGSGIDTFMILGYDDLHDAIPDTFPYSSELRIYMSGWHKSRPSALGETWAAPIIPRYRYKRWGPHDSDIFQTPWYPLDIDETCWDCATGSDYMTMSMGPFNYEFIARAYDESGQKDATPDTIYFKGNFQPSIDTVIVGYDSIPGGEIEFVPIGPGDTLFFGIDGAQQVRENVVTAFHVEPWFDALHTLIGYQFWYRCFINATGHDDPRDPTGSGIKAWQVFYQMVYYDWLENHPLNSLMHESIFKLYLPYDPLNPDTMYSVIDDPPDWAGEQKVTIKGADLRSTDTFEECIRVFCPTYDDTCGVVHRGPSQCLGHSGTGLVYKSGITSTDYTFYIKLIR